MITTTYHSPLGDIVLAADARGLVGLWFADCDQPDSVNEAGACETMDFEAGAQPAEAACGQAPLEDIEGHDSFSGSETMNAAHPQNTAAVSVLERTWAWLNAYFAGKVPQWIPPLHMGGTELEQEVRVALLSIPCGTTVSCEKLAQQIARRFAAGMAAKRSVQAQEVERAVERNPLAIIVPSHRVIEGSRVGLERSSAAERPGVAERLERLRALERVAAPA